MESQKSRKEMTPKRNSNVLRIETETEPEILIEHLLSLRAKNYTPLKDGKTLIKIEGDLVLDFKEEKYTLSIKEKTK